MWKAIFLVLFSALAFLPGPSSTGDHIVPPPPVPPFGDASAPCPWLPGTIRLKKDRDARTAELRRRILRKPLVDRYLAAATVAPHSSEVVETLANEAADFLGDPNAKLSPDSLALCRSMLANTEAEPVARLMALRMLWNKEDSVGKASEEEEKRFEQERLTLCRQILDNPDDPFVHWYASRVARYITSWEGALPDKKEYKVFAAKSYDMFIECMKEVDREEPDLQEPDLSLVEGWLRQSIFSNIDFRQDISNVFALTHLVSLLDKQTDDFKERHSAFINLIRGQLAHGESWKARVEWVSDVPQDNWVIIRAKTGKAKKLILDSYMSTPHNPLLADEMIGISRKSGGDELSWFKRGIAICFDYMPLYDSILFGMRPRWGGSHREMLTFGRQCLNTRRFDTWVPFMFAKTVQDVASERGGHWRGFLHHAPVREALVEMYEGYLAQSEAEEYRNEWLANYAYAMYLCGDYAEAGRLYTLIQTKVRTKEGRPRELASLWDRTGFAMMPKAVSMHVGGQGDILMEADAAEVAGDFTRAAALFGRAFSSFPDDPEAARYLRYRIGESLFWRDRESGNKKLGADHMWDWLFHFKNGPETVAFVAADANLSHALEQLLEYGLNVNPATPEEGSLLYFAVRGNADKCVRVLLKHGADPRVSHEGTTPLHLAGQNGATAIALQLLEAGADLEAVRTDGATPLADACFYKQREVMEALLRHGANPDVFVKNGSPPLVSTAIYYKDDAMTELLLRHGASPDLDDQRGVSPLLSAVYYKNANAVDILLRAGADVNKPSAGLLTTPLHMAAEDGHAGIAARLIEAGPDLDPRDKRGDTPLLSAARLGRAEVAKLLVEQGADVLIRNAAKQFPSQAARRAGHEELASYLFRAEAARAGMLALPGLVVVICHRRRPSGLDENGVVDASQR